MGGGPVGRGGLAARRGQHVIAHVAGVPVEEALPAFVGAGTALMVVRAQVMMRLRRRKETDR